MLRSVVEKELLKEALKRSMELKARSEKEFYATENIIRNDVLIEELSKKVSDERLYTNPDFLNRVKEFATGRYFSSNLLDYLENDDNNEKNYEGDLIDDRYVHMYLQELGLDPKVACSKETIQKVKNYIYERYMNVDVDKIAEEYTVLQDGSLRVKAYLTRRTVSKDGVELSDSCHLGMEGSDYKREANGMTYYYETDAASYENEGYAYDTGNPFSSGSCVREESEKHIHPEYFYKVYAKQYPSLRKWFRGRFSKFVDEFDKIDQEPELPEVDYSKAYTDEEIRQMAIEYIHRVDKENEEIDNKNKDDLEKISENKERIKKAKPYIIKTKSRYHIDIVKSLEKFFDGSLVSDYPERKVKLPMCLDEVSDEKLGIVYEMISKENEMLKGKEKIIHSRDASIMEIERQAIEYKEAKKARSIKQKIKEKILDRLLDD